MTLHDIRQAIKREVNYLFFREYRYRRVMRRHLAGYYSPDKPPAANEEKLVVGMADGRCLHGGLADRLRGMATLYSCCKEHGLRFAINFTFPFDLTEYLIPNLYDWRISQGELSMNSRDAIAVYMDNIDAIDEREPEWQKRIMEKFITLPYKQIHVYSSFDYIGDDFGRIFRELFRPAPRIAGMIDMHKATLGKEYISVSTRFMELLGDFNEPRGGTRLGPDERIALINRCIERIETLHQQHPGVKILVTSDSTGFLEACRRLDYTYTVEGQISHVDVAGNADHTKTFVDFLLIAGASHVYQLRTGAMYGGNFSLRAAQAGDRPYSRIDF